MSGLLAFVGGAEWLPGCTFDESLLAAAGTTEILVIPAAAAYEHPERKVAAAATWFADLGATVAGLDLLHRRDAERSEVADAIRAARFIYIADGSPLHLRSVLKDSRAWHALVDAWHGGAAVVGSAAGATILGDPMVDPRGGTFTLGLGLVRRLAVVPHWDTWTGDRARRMSHLTPTATVVAEIEERTALIRWADGTWTTQGAGTVTLSLDHRTIGASAVEATVDSTPAEPVTQDVLTTR